MDRPPVESPAPGDDQACIETRLLPGQRDVVAARVLHAAREAGLELPATLHARRGWSLRVRGGPAAAQALGRRLLADPVLHDVRVFAPRSTPAEPGWRRLEVARRAGVMDPSAQSVVRAAAALGIEVSDVRSWSAWLVPADTPDAVLLGLGRGVLANDVVEELRLDPATGVAPAPRLPDQPVPPAVVPLRELDAAGLVDLSRRGCLALDAVEMGAIASHFRGLGRDPGEIELETLAQTWSEHCKHKTLTGLIDYEGERIDNLLKSTIVAATRTLDRPWCRSVFVDNAGVVDFDEQHLLTFKVETHNHPSALEPYGGAGTGLGGVLRDTLGTGLGARPVASTDVFCLGPPDLPRDRVPKGSLPPLRVLKGVVAGVRDYGNRMGIPTVGGAVCFDERYTANPLVYCGSIGLLPRDRLEKRVAPGDLIVLCGGATGRDGIHGATFSSLELHDESERVSSGAVQIGNAIEEKRLMDALLQARDLGLFRCVTDCGAGGLSSAVGEMAEGHGAEVELDAVPLKYHGLSATEIWISEAQERMVLAVPPGQRAALLALFAAEDVPATVIGRFTASGRLVARFRGAQVMDLALDFLHGGLPRQVRVARRRRRVLADPANLPVGQARATLLALLGDPDVASKAWIVRQYDHEVLAGTVIKPLVGVRHDGPSDGAVIAPVLGSRRGFAVGHGINPSLGDVDPFRMALHAIDEAMRNVVAVGGDPGRCSILDNFSWGNCEKPENLGDLVEACRACQQGAVAYGVPFISGKDSLNNDYRVGGESRSIPPTLLISALALVDDVGACVTMDAKAPGHLLVLVGETGPELGGSRLARLLGATGAEVPPVDLVRGPAILRAVHEAIRRGLPVACHDLSEGGLAVAAAELAFSGGVGLRLDVSAMPRRRTAAGPAELDPGRRLFAESPSRFLLELPKDRLAALEDCLRDLPYAVVGRTLVEPVLEFVDGARPILSASLDELHRAWAAPLDLDREQVSP